MIAIWGANGFIGRHLTHHLAELHVPLTLFARNFEGFPFSLSDHAKAVATDFMNPYGYCEALKDCSVLILAVSASAATTFMDDPEKEIVYNVDPYKKLFGCLKQLNIMPKRIVYLSSGGAIYGITPPIPVREDFPLNPNTPYGMGKADIEKSLIGFCHESGCEYTILRIANPVGRWWKKPSLVPVALNCAKNDVPLNIQGSGRNVRDYFDVGELAAAIASVISNDLTKNTILNVGSGEGHSINDIVNIVEGVTRKRIVVKNIPEPAFNIPYNVLDCGRIRHYTEWMAKKAIDEIIDEMWNSK